MKKTIIFTFVILGLLLHAEISNAQFLGVELVSVNDSSVSGYCSAPDTMSFNINGNVGGYLPTDSIFVEVFFGDGNSTSLYTPIVFGIWLQVINLQHVYQLPGNYSVMVIATGPNGASDTLIDNSVIVATACGNLSGIVYFDSNNNCAYDSGETLMPNMQIAINSGGNNIKMAYTDTSGYYNVQLGSGFTYDISLNTTIAPVNCPVSGSHMVSTLPSNNLDFGLTCQPGFDYTVNSYAFCFRPNLSTYIFFDPENLILSCNPPASSLTITLDPMLSYLSASIPPSNINGQQITFNTGSLSPSILNQGLLMNVMTSGSANIGDTVCILSQVDPVTGDSDVSNNIANRCWPICNSYDPNQKQEDFAGTGTANILPGTELNYTIMFQNLGNDDAIDIYIIDTLDASLEPSSFQFISSSHEPVITFHQNNIVRFEFKNIYLPAASVNEPASHGYVNYKIYAPHFLTNGTQIQNTAHIFFDFNPAIVTNTVTHIIDLTSGIQTPEEPAIQFYPNPAVNELFIQQDDAQESTVEIFDITGKRVHFSTVKGSGSIEVSQLAKGSYILTVTGDRQSRSMKLILQ